MAELRKIVRREVASNFRQVAPSGGGMFYALAAAADTAYKMLEPVAIKNMQEQAEEDFRTGAKNQVVNPGYVQPVSGPPAPPLDPNSPEGIAADARKAVSGTSAISDSLSVTESGGNYSVRNSEGFTGKYQWGQPRLDDYNRANGTNFNLDQFRADPALQERAQAWHEADIMSDLGGYVGRTAGGLPMTEGAIIAMAHLGGTEGARKFIESDGAYNPSDSNGTHLSDYARTHGGANFGGGAQPNPSGQPETYQPTMIRAADGKLSAKLYSPASGPILQAYNAAAGMAYVQEMSMTGLKDIMGMSQDHLLDPTGFEQAATAYVDEMIKNAPKEFRSDLRTSMEKEVQRRVLGIMDDRQADIRQRASNSNTALMQSRSMDLSAAIASGNPDEIAAAEDEMYGVLAARERIPGMAWTPEQSALEVQRARASGATMVREQQNKQKATWNAALEEIADAAGIMMHSDQESILNDPNVRANADPDKLRAATAAVMLRDVMPELGKMTPAQVAEVVATEKAKPVTNGYQVDLVKGLEDFATRQKAAFEADPVAAAQTYFPQDEKPEPLPEFDPMNPGDYTAALERRSLQMKGLVDAGYTSKFTLLSDAEIAASKAVFAKESPADIKAVAAGQIVGALGEDAATYFKNVGADDPILSHVGMLMARGGNEQAAIEAMRGAELLSSGQAQKPTRAATVTEVDPAIALALSAVLPYDQMGDVMETAKAIAAYRNPNTADPTSDEAKKAMKDALQVSLGQTKDKHGEVIGGIQDINGGMTLLPPTINGKTVENALEKAFYGEGMRVWNEMQPEIWDALGGMPTLGGEPITPSEWYNERVVLTPMGGNFYRLSLNIGGQMVDVGTNGSTERPYIFDMTKLLEAAQ